MIRRAIAKHWVAACLLASLGALSALGAMTTWPR